MRHVNRALQVGDRAPAEFLSCTGVGATSEEKNTGNRAARGGRKILDHIGAQLQIAAVGENRTCTPAPASVTLPLAVMAPPSMMYRPGL